MNQPGTRAALALLCLLLPNIAGAQGRFHPGQPVQPTASSDASPPAVVGASIIVTVADEAGMPLDEQAVVRLYDETRQTVVWGTTRGRSEAQFDHLPSGPYEIEVSANGFKTVRQEVNATSSHEAYRILMTMSADIPGTVSDIQLGQVLAPKPRKEAEKGIRALNERKFDQAQKHFEAAYKLAPTSADVNYLLGVLYARQKKQPEAEKYLNQAISLDPRHAGALTELGAVLLERGDVAGAMAVLEPAVTLAPKRWRVHELLAEADFRLGQYEKAQQQAAMAVRESKGEASTSRLLMAQAFAKLGRTREAVECLEALLRDQPHGEAAPQARELMAKLQSQPPVGTPVRQ